MSQVITKREAADILGVSPSAVQRMMGRGELQVHETIRSSGDGRAVAHLFKRIDVEALAERRAA